MLAVIVWPLLIAIVGLVVYLAAKDKATEAGRILFLCGMLGVVWLLTSATVSFPRSTPAAHR